MNQNQIIILLSTAALTIYLISYIRKRPAALLSFLGRGAAGLSYIYLFNSFFIARGIATHLGINLITFGLSAFLGIPGVLLAYGVNLLRFL